MSGRVPYYDVQAGRIRECASGKLLAIEDLNTPEVESYLNKIESTLAAKLGDLADGGEGQRRATLAEPLVARALTMLLLLQVHRTKEALADKNTDATLANVLKRDDGFWSQTIGVFEGEYRLATVALPGERRFFLPDTGFFMVPIPHQHLGFDWAFAMPLTPTAAVTALPRGARLDQDDIEGLIQQSSVGRSSKMKRVIIPPEYLARFDRKDLAVEVATAIKFVDQLFHDVIRVRELAAGAYAVAGLSVPGSERFSGTATIPGQKPGNAGGM